MFNKSLHTQTVDALQVLRPKAEWHLSGDKLKWLDTNQTQPSQTDIDNKIVELQAAEPMRLLRIERNQKLAETDWWAGKDVTMSQARKNYRQALRDLPATANPTLDENGNLTNVTWPTKPE